MKLKRRKHHTPANLPSLNAKRHKRCIGVEVYRDVGKKPLVPCKEHAAVDSPFCKAHGKQEERQRALLAVLKPAWKTSLKAKRGRRINRVPSPEEAVDRATKPLPNIPDRDPSESWKPPAPKERPSGEMRSKSPRPAPAALPSYDDALAKLTKGLPKIP